MTVNQLNIHAILLALSYSLLGYRPGDPGSIPGTTRKKSSRSGTESTQPQLLSLLSLVSTTEELLDRKVAAPV
jgi:hypothetical protein